MLSVAVRYVTIVVGLAIAWLLIGRPLSLFVDRFIAIRTPLVTAPFDYDGGGFLIGKLSMTFGATDNLRSNLELQTDSVNRVVLSIGGRSFILGPRTNPVDPAGRPEIDLVPEQGDQLSFSAERSLIGWPTPFEFHFMISHSPWWKRYVYYRLVWQKASGAKLEMKWRYEQQYYAATGWTEPAMMWNGQTGLLGVEILP